MIGIDRLSDLPEAVLHKILSLLDTKIVVQSSVLSRGWRHIWKDVPVLNFYQDSFRNKLEFEQHVEQVLSHRSNCDVAKISANFLVRESEALFDRILRYAASHHIQELCVPRFYDQMPYTILSDSVVGINICHQTLGVLDLQYAVLDEATFESLSSLKMLKTMALTFCEFWSDGVAGEMNPFAMFSKLENLKIIHCYPNDEGENVVVRVFGPQLMSLEVHDVLFGGVDLYAPKLECFSYWVRIDSPRVSTRINFPSLEHASINMWRRSRGGNYDQELLSQCVDFFGRLRNITTLSLHLDTNELLSQVSPLVKNQPSPFEYLKSLNVTCCCEGPLDVPDEVSRYFLEGFHEMEVYHVIAEKVPNWCDPYRCVHLLSYGDKDYHPARR